ncbi:MAG: FHA domain-containing protein [Anaerolineales bacterium]|nr:FHA domain-containing protein [Anaerolineales bacterium]
MGYKNYRLTIIKGFNKGEVFPLEGDEIIIGRGEENGIVLNIAEVSRTHSILTKAEEGYMIKDLGSTNGTFVDKKKIGGKYLLKPGDTVMLGDAIYMTYQADIDPDETLVAPRQEEFPKPDVTAVTPKPVERKQEPAPQTTPRKDRSTEEILSQDQVTEEKKGKTWLWAGIGCVVVVFFLIVVGLITFDYLNLYCTPPFDTFLNFLYTCPS